MTSERPAECFVYITLPGETAPVTAGRYGLTKDRRGNAVGRFMYGRHYLERQDAVPIDPVELKLSGATFETALLGGVFGALRDAGPDYWGRRVIEKHSGKTNLGEVDYLLESPDDRAGALGFGLDVRPPAPKREFNKTFHLEKLQELADALIRDEIKERGIEAAQVEDLLLLGTSMGGARPKAVVENDEGLWVAKFNRPDDRWNNARVEYAMLVLARACGMLVAQSRMETIGGKDVLLVKRFDRERTDKGYRRARMVSGLTLLRTDDAPEARSNWSYVSLVEELRRISANAKQDARELFSRMCFNALISNIDDHPRNHAVIALNRDWRLSPAYDLTPTPAISLDRRDLAMTCGDLGRFANARNLVSQHARFLLEADEAQGIVDGLSEQVRGSWYDTVRGCGVAEADAQAISAAFAYEGFFN